MLNFLKHSLTKREKFLARWGARHLLSAIVVGVLMACGLLWWQTRIDAMRVDDLQQAAAQAIIDPDSALPPNTGKIGGGFTLVDQDNLHVTDKDFAGHYLMIYFGYTSCPDMCPTGLQSMSRAMDMLGAEADKVQPLFITVDPPRDTPQRLKEYISSFHPKIIGLTGSAAQIAAVAKEYQVYYKKGDGDTDYEVEHSSVIYLMSPKGDLITTFTEEADPQAIVAALRKAWQQNPS